jgi:hypothetical protein
MRNTMKKAFGLLVTTAAMLGFCASSSSAAVDILWYTGGVEVGGGAPAGTYVADINALAGQVATGGGGAVAPATWNVTFWSGGAMPGGSYNVLVVASPQGGWGINPNYAALYSAAPAFGDRVMITGQDADWHYTNSPGPTNFDNPQGFLIDAINWAGNGSGMGAVILGPDGSNLNLTTLGLSGFGSETNFLGNNSVNIPGALASFPINEGLTSAGLSNWNSSSHTSWTGADASQWTAINVDGFGTAVTLVSAETAGGGTGPGDSNTPEASSIVVWAGLGLVGMTVLIRRRNTA